MLRSLRRQVMWTQEDLAKRSGVSVGTIAGIESGRVARPRGATVRMLADALRLSERQLAELTAAARSEPLAGSAEPIPAQLPSAVAGFAGRVDVLRRLDELLTDDAGEHSTAVVIAAVSGTAGVGKTALAVHWAHRVRERFPDGQLYVNLRGFDPSSPAMDPAEALRGFLEALGVAPQRIPVDLNARASLYRSLLSDKRVLVVLDNARDTDQVRPLLPGSNGCVVVVTSRTALTGLVAVEGAHAFTLDLLTTSEAHQLFSRRLGRDRVAAEPDAVAEIIQQTTRLPLALAIVAARAAISSHLTLLPLVAELRDQRTRLDALNGGDASIDVRAVFSWSYEQLTCGSQRLFRLLGSHPGPTISAPAAASLAGIPSAELRRYLAELAHGHLIAEHPPGRFGFHDLLRTYAAELAHTTDRGETQQQAVRRMLDHYLHTAFTAERLLNPKRDPISIAAPADGVSPEPFGDREEAIAWFRIERPVLLATVNAAANSGFDVHAWKLAWSNVTFLMRQGHWADQIACGQVAATAARRLGDLPAQARIEMSLAHACTRIGRLSDAHRHLQRSLDLSTQLGNRAEQARVYSALAYLFEQEGNVAKALDCAQRSLELYREAGTLEKLSEAHNAVGWYHAVLGDHDQALRWCEQALAFAQQHGDHGGEAAVRDSLGFAHHQLGHHQAAITCFQRALDLWRQLGSRHYEAESLTRLGDTQYSAGDSTAARQSWRQARAIFEDLGHHDAEAVRAKLDNLERPEAGRRQVEG